MLLVGCSCGSSDLAPEPGEELSGGAATVNDESSSAFSRPFPRLTRELERKFFRGRALFRDGWVQAPASTDSRDGLGPVFNARSCFACHVDDGRGRPPIGDEVGGSLLFRLSVMGPDGPIGDPTYGDQLQPLGVLGVPGEGQPRITYDEVPGQFVDGTPYSLAQPLYSFDELPGGPLANGAMISPRVAPQMIGLGLLEAIPPADIEALADPDDADDDGISGRVNRVFDVEANTETIGRFGWKSNQPNVRQQSAGAFGGDLGLTTSLFPNEPCTDLQTDCLESPSGGSPEILEAILDNVAFYSRTLAVPIRRDWDTQPVLRGKQQFEDLGCASCHAPTLVTGDIRDLPEFSGETIRPYTDLLLHDMGPELADNRPDFLADGQEWRTPPLWGLGLIKAVNLHENLLHDGRARNIVEAILWHGGEAKVSREAFRNLSAADRDDLIAFLESL